MAVTSRAAAPRTRDVMLRQAARLFAERGFRGTSVEDIGAACGVSGPAVYKHFAGKDEILARLLVDISEQLVEGGRQVLTGEPDPATALRSLAEFHADFTLGEPISAGCTARSQRLAGLVERAVPAWLPSRPGGRCSRRRSRIGWSLREP